MRPTLPECAEVLDFPAWVVWALTEGGEGNRDGVVRAMRPVFCPACRRHRTIVVEKPGEWRGVARVVHVTCQDCT